MVTDSKASTELKINKFSELISNEVHKLDNFCLSFNKKVDVLMGEISWLVEDLTTFNKSHSGDLKLRSAADGKVFEKIEKSLSGFQETLSKILYFITIFDLSIIYLCHGFVCWILDLVLRLLTNDTHLAHVSQGGER